MVRNGRLHLWLTLLVFLLPLAVYLLTLAPTVTLIDSGELILTAWGLDIAHPPGFPLYVLIGAAFARLPIGNVAQRLNGGRLFSPRSPAWPCS